MPRLSEAETDIEYRIRLEDTCRDRYRMEDHPLERHRIPQPLQPEEQGNARTKTAEKEASDGTDPHVGERTDDDSSPPRFWLSRLGGAIRKVGELNGAARVGPFAGAKTLVLP